MPDRLADLQHAMRVIADAVEGLPDECRDLAGNALLNIAAEAVAQDVGCLEAGRIFARLADLLARGPEESDLDPAAQLDGAVGRQP